MNAQIKVKIVSAIGFVAAWYKDQIGKEFIVESSTFADDKGLASYRIIEDGENGKNRYLSPQDVEIKNSFHVELTDANPNFWYRGEKVGTIFTVIDGGPEYYLILGGTFNNYGISKEHAKVVEQQKQEPLPTEPSIPVSVIQAFLDEHVYDRGRHSKSTSVTLDKLERHLADYLPQCTIPFSIENYQRYIIEGVEHVVLTREGKKVEIFKTNSMRENFPVFTLVNGETPAFYTANGFFYENEKESTWDLVIKLRK